LRHEMSAEPPNEARGTLPVTDDAPFSDIKASSRSFEQEELGADANTSSVMCILVRNFVRETEPKCPVTSIAIDLALDAAFIGDASGIVATLHPIGHLLQLGLGTATATHGFGVEDDHSATGSTVRSSDGCTEERNDHGVDCTAQQHVDANSEVKNHVDGTAYEESTERSFDMDNATKNKGVACASISPGVSDPIKDQAHSESNEKGSDIHDLPCSSKDKIAESTGNAAAECEACTDYSDIDLNEETECERRALKATDRPLDVDIPTPYITNSHEANALETDPGEYPEVVESVVGGDGATDVPNFS